MSGVIPRNLKKNDVSTSKRFPGVHKRGIHTDTQTHTQTHTHTHMSIAIDEMQCVACRLKMHSHLSRYSVELSILNSLQSLNYKKANDTVPTAKLTFRIGDE